MRTDNRAGSRPPDDPFGRPRLAAPAGERDDVVAEGLSVVERFGEARRKYFYFEERKYWHMGDPHSDDPEQRPNVINRTWVDVRRNADNVSHVWTAEEVELQMRLWEIQLEKATDRSKSETVR